MLTTSSCREEIEVKEPDDRISYNVANHSDATTKSQEEEKTVTFEVAGQKISLSMTECDNREENLATRGAAYDNSTNPIPSIIVSAIAESGNGGSLYFSGDKVDVLGGHGTGERFWPEQKLSFMAYAVSKEGITIDPEFSRSDSKCFAEFDYTLPAAAVSGAKKDATAQPDIVFAITPDKAGPTDVDLVFHHALSAINFKIGQMDPDKILIKSIAIKGVYKGGHCHLTQSGANDIAFSWAYDGQSQNGHYTEDINMTVDSSDGDDNGTLMNDTEATFMMLPQSLSDATKFVMTFSIEGREYTLEKAFNTIVSSWEADKKYVFKIGLPDEIDVDIEDQVEEFIKKDVTIQNTGVATGYIRAAIIGYWVSSSTGRICDPWRDDEGTFVFGNEWNSNWKKGVDGFYYHLKPVEHNGFTYPLFNTYTINDQAIVQHANHTLEIDLAVQIIPISEKSVWPELASMLD